MTSPPPPSLRRAVGALGTGWVPARPGDTTKSRDAAPTSGTGELKEDDHHVRNASHHHRERTGERSGTRRGRRARRAGCRDGPTRVAGEFRSAGWTSL